MSFQEYIAHGWALCGLPHGKKSPEYAGWNVTPIGAEAIDGFGGAGLLHALSGTCAVDVDSLERATPWLAERGIDLEALLQAQDAVRIESGREGRTKLLYRMRKPLRTLKPAGSGLELRCATAGGKSVHDALPPSVHPLTRQSYRWECGIVGDWAALPPLPAALLTLWRELAGTERPVDEPAESKQPSQALGDLRKVIARKDPDLPYDDWIKVGMALHHESSGSGAGLAAWDEWSAKGKKYKGQLDLRTHWLSFGSAPGKRVVTGGALMAESVATADEFDVVTPAEAAAPVSKADKGANAAAVAMLEARLIYVCQVDRYLDTERRDVLPTDHAVRHRFTHAMPRTKGGRRDPVKLLRESPNRTVVDGIAFHPGAEGIFTDGDARRYANTYRPLTVELLEPTARELDHIAWLFDKIHDPRYRTWLLQFLAHMVQRPGVKIRSCPLIWSEITGNGKSTMLSTIPRELVGRQYHQEVDYVALEEKFNGYLRDKWVVSLKEFKAGTKAERIAIAQRLRPWITDDYIPIREMRTDTYDVPNRFVLTATSNESDAAPIDENDRRWGVYELDTDPIAADEVRDIIVGFFNGPRARGVLHSYFRRLSLTGFNPDMRPPDTDARREMIEASVAQYEEVLRVALEEHSGPFVRDCVSTEEITQFLRHRGVFPPSAHRLGRWLRAQRAIKRTIRDARGRQFRTWIMRNPERWDVVSEIELLAHISGETPLDIAS